MSQGSSSEKQRGAYFTPDAVADYLVDFAVQGPTDRILEPSCGDGRFLLSAVRRLRQLGNRRLVKGQLIGVENHGPSVRNARENLRREHSLASILARDFWSITDGETSGAVDAVVGNPPYVRFQLMSADQRTRAQSIAAGHGVELSRASSSWASLLVHAASFLNDGGRLAMVLPSELLWVKYASPLRRFIEGRFATIRIVAFDHLIFPQALEDVVLLLGEGYGRGPASGFRLSLCRDISELPPTNSLTYPLPTTDKWSDFLGLGAGRSILDALVSAGEAERLGDWSRVQLGTVTGLNDYFVMRKSDAVAERIPDAETIKIAPSSRSLPQWQLTDANWASLPSDQQRVLFHPRVWPSQTARRRLRRGRRDKLDDSTFKLRSRRPWWKYSALPPPDFFLTYMNHESFRLVLNQARVGYLNSLYGVTLRAQVDPSVMELLPYVFHNTATLLSGELEGRSYGGGVLKVEPSEAARLVVPPLAVVQETAAALRSAISRPLDADGTRRAIDSVVLPAVGLSEGERETLEAAWISAKTRRHVRSQSRGTSA